MNHCVFEPVHGREPICDGVCKHPEKTCPYYFVDKVWEIMKDWKKDAGVDTPIVWKHDNKRNKICLYTNHPGMFIGLNGERYKRFVEKLCEADPVLFKQNGVDLIEYDDYIGE